MKRTMISLRAPFIALALVFIYSSAFSQFKGVRFAGGVSTVEILSNNLATKNFIHKEGDETFSGGSFDQSQPGFRLEALFAIDDEETFEIPVGLDYHFYMGREKDGAYDVTHILKKNDTDVLTWTLGLNYSFFKFNPINSVAKFYVSLDTRTAIVFQGHFEQDKFSADLKTHDILALDTKKSAVRLGGALSIGLNGRIYDPVYVDFKAGFGLMNLIGRNHVRGELLTPFKYTTNYTENHEGYLYNFHFSMLVQIEL